MAVFFVGSLFLEVEKVVRGCQKRIVYLKSTGSEVFSDAYFVVRDNALSDICECDMVKEANKILDECVSLDEKLSLGQTVFEIAKRKIIPFLLGTVVGMIIVILIK